MAICRFGEASDLYVYHDVSGGICCCNCALQNGGNFKAETEREMLAHLERHQRAGHKVPADALEELAAASP